MKKISLQSILGFICGVVFVQLSIADQLCVYIDDNNTIIQVHSLTEVPKQYISRARCFEVKPSKGKKSETIQESLAAPKDVSLKGSIRSENISSSLGRIELRWPRSVELLFGRTPQQAITEAARVVSRTLKSGGFPVSIQSLSLDWHVVFMEAELPEKEIPSYLQHSCHPAWMTPPANLYFVSKRIAQGCTTSKQRVETMIANETLAQVAIHEMGHAVEHALLQDVSGMFGADRERAEGFASWFEWYAAGYSSIVDKQKVLAQFKLSAPYAGDVFKGDASDYALSALKFIAIQEKFGIRGVFKVFEVMKSEKIQFKDAVKKIFKWDQVKLKSEALKLS